MAVAKGATSESGSECFPGEVESCTSRLRGAPGREASWDRIAMSCAFFQAGLMVPVRTALLPDPLLGGADPYTLALT